MQNEEEQSKFFDDVNSHLQEVMNALIDYCKAKLQDENTEPFELLIDLTNLSVIIQNMTMLYQDWEDVPTDYEEEEDTTSSSDG